jgi:hypothetical protein
MSSSNESHVSSSSDHYSSNPNHFTSTSSNDSSNEEILEDMDEDDMAIFYYMAIVRDPMIFSPHMRMRRG